MGWCVFESPGVDSVFLEKDQAFGCAETRARLPTGEIWLRRLLPKRRCTAATSRTLRDKAKSPSLSAARSAASETYRLRPSLVRSQRSSTAHSGVVQPPCAPRKKEGSFFRELRAGHAQTLNYGREASEQCGSWTSLHNAEQY